MAYYDQGFTVGAGYLPKFGEAVLSGLKTGQDLRKGALDMQKTQAETAKLNAEMQPNTGIAALGQSEWAQKVNAQMQAYIQAGYPPTQDTYRKAINDVQATNVQQYTDPMGNRVTLGGVPLPPVGMSTGQQPVLGGQQFSTQQPVLAPYGTGGEASEAEKVVSSIQDDIANATPEEKAFVNEVMNSPNPAETYNARVQEHPELAQAQPKWNDTVAQHFSEVNSAMSEGVPTGQTIFQPPKGLEPTRRGIASPMAEGEKVKEHIKYGYRTQAELDDVKVPGFSIAQGQKPSATDAKDMKAASEVIRTMGEDVREYKTLVKKHGSETVGGAAAQFMKQHYANILLNLKEFQNLGVLNPNDREIMEEMIPDATSLLGGFNPYRQENVLAGLDIFDKYLKRKIDAKAKTKGYIPDRPTLPDSLPQGTKTNPDGTFTLPDGRVIRKKQ